MNGTASLGWGHIFNNASILWISGIGVSAIIAGLFGSIVYNQYLTGQLKELSKMNNSNIPEEQTNTCIEQIKQQAIDHLYQFNIELRSLNDINGIINCNITTQQYIPSFKCDNLNLNYCNINHIGTLNATPGIFGSISTTNNTNKSSTSVVLYNTNTIPTQMAGHWVGRPTGQPDPQTHRYDQGLQVRLQPPNIADWL